MNNTYDYIITGGGAAGLMLALRFTSDRFFDDKTILIIDESTKEVNDRTWCFWSKEKAFIDSCISFKWETVQFKSADYTKNEAIAPYTYNKIRSLDFYNYANAKIKSASNITVLNEKVSHIDDVGSLAQVCVGSTVYRTSQVFNSILFNKAFKQGFRFPLINQHFVGWSIKTKDPVFDPKVATFMDFDIPQNERTRFMYVLPTSANEALLEYTLFSKDILPKEVYEAEIRNYLAHHNIEQYEIQEEELGCIPMTCYPFWKHNSAHVHHIGIAGGWAKPSTGYTFRNSIKKTQTIVEQIKNNQPIRTKRKDQFWFYDLLLLDILDKQNNQGSRLFSEMFKHNTMPDIFKFLDQETSFSQNMKTIWSMPKFIFIKALIKRLIGKH